MSVGRSGDQLLATEAGDVTRCGDSPEGVKHEGPCGVQQPPTCLTAVCCSHLAGMFFRTVRMLEAGMKPM